MAMPRRAFDIALMHQGGSGMDHVCLQDSCVAMSGNGTCTSHAKVSLFRMPNTWP